MEDTSGLVIKLVIRFAVFYARKCALGFIASIPVVLLASSLSGVPKKGSCISYPGADDLDGNGCPYALDPITISPLNKIKTLIFVRILRKGFVFSTFTCLWF